jgi:hypothetical protein
MARAMMSAGVVIYLPAAVCSLAVIHGTSGAD